MILYVASNEYHLCKKRSCIRTGDNPPLSNQIFENGYKPPTLPTKNGAIHTLS